MKLTPFKLLVLRTFNVTLGRFAWADRLLRRMLLLLLVKKKEVPYVQSARFFAPDELD
ncbi:MAG TPA: hypothetical protein VFF73_24010 [Planctomycetota bacterium]|nr:hypothetical protein [Planctomycetota bacterium]